MSNSSAAAKPTMDVVNSGSGSVGGEEGGPPAAATAATAKTTKSGSNLTTTSSFVTTAKVTVGARCTIAQDTDIRGTVHFGDATVVHPKASIHALDESGSIVFGAQCIVEENVQIVHRGAGVMRIGDKNLFEVGCRVEAQQVGSHNVFACKSKTLDTVRIQDFTTVGVGCIAQPPNEFDVEVHSTTAEKEVYTFPSRTVIYGEQSAVRTWSGNGVRQADALHAKHLDHLRRSKFKDSALTSSFAHGFALPFHLPIRHSGISQIAHRVMY